VIAMTSKRGTERGAVTAEFAVALPVVVLLLVAILTLGAASSAQMRALDAARSGARALAIGQTEAEAASAAQQVGGMDVSVTIERDGSWITVVATKPVVGGWLARLPLRATGTATAWLEP